MPVSITITLVPAPNGQFGFQIAASEQVDRDSMLSILAGAMSGILAQPPASPVIETAKPEHVGILLNGGGK
jgi:hypothetical protein